MPFLTTSHTQHISHTGASAEISTQADINASTPTILADYIYTIQTAYLPRLHATSSTKWREFAYVNAPNKKETFMSNLVLSTNIIVVSILVPVYSHEHRVNYCT